VPSGKDPLAVHGIVPNGENFDPSEILMSGASKVIDLLNRYRWDTTSDDNKLLILPTTFDPSACILDEGLMIELDRRRNGKEVTRHEKTLMTMGLPAIGEFMCQPNNGLIIRDRWWHCTMATFALLHRADIVVAIYEDSFTGEMFVNWLEKTFADVKNREDATDHGRRLFQDGLIGE